MFKKVAIAAALGVAAFSSNAVALIATNTIAVSATISAACSVATSALAFGTFPTTVGGNHDLTSSLNVTCATGLPYTVGIDVGNNALGSVRRLSDGASHFITYEVYSDSLGGTPWDVPATSIISGTGNAAAQPFNVFARIPSTATTPTAGAYTDTLTVTVTY